MCAIIGQYNTDEKIEVSVFNMLRDTMEHRGPDSEGTEVMEQGMLALGHRRLSIIDLSSAGKQPMSNENGSIWVTFNGEIYNYVNLRNDLISKGHVFKSSSDSEVLVHGYEEWGIEILLSKLNGMFAFGIWDSGKKNIVLARDRFGIKPLYYSLQNNKLLFASELRALHAQPNFDREIDWSAAMDFLVHRFIPNPKSIWKSCRKLEPGSYLIISKELKIIRHSKYWNLISDDLRLPEREVQDTFNELMYESVKNHLVSDVPVGLFLSAGIDSSSILHYSAREMDSVNTFSIGFNNWDLSEHYDARAISEIYKTNHADRLLSTDDIEMMNVVSEIYDEPQGGSSFLPTISVSELASKTVKVVLAGDGGDELLAGYNWHRSIFSRSTSLKNRFLTDSMKKNALATQYWKHLSWTGFSYSDVDMLFGLQCPNLSQKEDLYKSKIQTKENTLKSLQRLDLETYLTDVFLPKVDRASMASSLEVRVPFLNHKLFEYIFSLSVDSYFDPVKSKFLLRNILAKKIPQSILTRPKQGFSSPLDKNKIWSAIASSVQNGSLREKRAINSVELKRILDERNFSKLWSIYLLDNWIKKWT